ncbi:MAG: hypothetical protein SFY81_09410 [Verrucomicrobiota bacterium]|nr:hypothetical protein [Verrucomicrobiota bacterium]
MFPRLRKHESEVSLFERASGVFYIEDTETKRQESLKTKEKDVAHRLWHAKNEAHEQPAINLQIARAYLAATDAGISTRTWQHVMDAMRSDKTGPTLHRWLTAIKDKAFDSIRTRVLLETKADDLRRVLDAGSVATNVFLRRIHNFALGMGWIAWPILGKKQWPEVRFADKRAITWDEHLKILDREPNKEKAAFYDLAWHIGAAQTDLANLKAEDIDWGDCVIAFRRAEYWDLGCSTNSGRADQGLQAVISISRSSQRLFLTKPKSLGIDIL